MEIMELLQICINRGASDLHISEGTEPRFRVDGDLIPVEGCRDIDERKLFESVMRILLPEQLKLFAEQIELDFAVTLQGIGRFRVNVFHHCRGVGVAFRVIPEKVLTLENLGFPDTFRQLAEYPHGMVLITGPTGSGKTTTLAALINEINHRRTGHILTIEDPIEYIHQSNTCLINQREVNRDTKSFQAALRAALREDPDVILVGELRDLETVRLALTAAETGHLVLATLHTSSAAKTINRITDVFPSSEKNLVRSLLSESLQAIVSQTLVKRIGGGRVAAFELLMCNGAVKNLIREDKIPQIYSVMQTGASSGMKTLDQHLKSLVANQTILRETAQEIAINKEFF